MEAIESLAQLWMAEHPEFLSIPVVYLSGETNVPMQVEALREIVFRAVDEAAADPRMDDQHRQTVRQGDRTHVEAAAIDQQGMASEPVRGGELIHIAAAHAHEIAFGALRYQRDRCRIEPAGREQHGNR